MDHNELHEALGLWKSRQKPWRGVEWPPDKEESPTGMRKLAMKPRPFHLWWLGVLLFGTAVLSWCFDIVILGFEDIFTLGFNWHSLQHMYLPILAALVGLVVPIVCLRLLRHSSAKRWVPVFVIYAATMLTWGVIDIRNENYQIGGHTYPNGPLVDGHRGYFHLYTTWYFMPYKFIEKGID